MPVTGTTVTLRTKLTNPDTGAPEDAASIDDLTLKLIQPSLGVDGKPVEHILKGSAAEIEHDGEAESGDYHADFLGLVSGEWHYEWLLSGSAISQGDFTYESKRPDGEGPDLTDLKVLVPRARRKVEGPWGNANGRPPLSETQVYEMIGDAVGDMIALSGAFFHHTLIVKERDALGGYPTAWKTDTELEEYEAAIICAQVALNYYFHVFNNMRIMETIQNEGTLWTYQLSANVIKNYLETLRDERDKAIEGLRTNIPILDRFASNIRVRDQATVAVLEWWDQQSDASAGGLPGGQEATNIPWFTGQGLW